MKVDGVTVRHLEILVEERSMEAFLRILLPPILGPDLGFRILTFRGKHDLLQSLPQRLRAYAKFLQPHTKILVLVDRDDGDCLALKRRLDDAARQAGLVPRSDRRGDRFQVVNRIVVEELEAWYFGDWHAVRAAFPKVRASTPNRSAYRDPDAIQGGTWESFERLLQKAGYFGTGLTKIAAARAIAPHVDPARQRSKSFRALHSALVELAADPESAARSPSGRGADTDAPGPGAE